MGLVAFFNVGIKLLTTSVFGQYYPLFKVVDTKGGVTKVKVATLKDPDRETHFRQYFGVIYEVDNYYSSSEYIKDIFSTSYTPSDEEGVAEFYIHQKIGEEKQMCRAKYILNTKTGTIIEKIYETPYPQSNIVDKSPSRSHFLNRNNNSNLGVLDYSLAVIKMYLSRCYFDAILSRRVKVSENIDIQIDPDKTRDELYKEGLFNY